MSDLARAYGLVLDEWQDNVLEAAMGERADGQWAASTVGVNVARQNGKGALLEARALAGLLLFDEQTIIHSAHEQKTARVGFERLLQYFENFDDLRKKVRGVMNAVNREYIRLSSGATIYFPARSKGALRGFSIDCLLLDEAQILGDPAWEAIKPTLSARPNVQTWLLGTTPTPLDDSAAFERTRARALAGKDKRLAWCEWSAPEGADISSPETWAMANPARGGRISVEAIADELAELSVEGFRRERLSIWPTAAESDPRAIDADSWRGATIPVEDASPEWPLAAIAVDMDEEGRAYAAMAVRSGPETVHVEIADHDLLEASVSEAVLWLRDRARRRLPVVIPSDSGATILEAPLLAQKMRVYRLNSTEIAQASASLAQAIRDGEVTHLDDAGLAADVASAPRQDIPRSPGRWRIGRSGPTSSALLLAVAAARMGAVKWGPRGSTGRSGNRRAAVM